MGRGPGKPFGGGGAGLNAPLQRAVLPLAQGVVAALAALPGASDVERFRAQALASPGKFAARMQGVERVHAAGRMTDAGLAELWTWAAYAVVVRGSPADTSVNEYARAIARLMTWAIEQRLDYTALTTSDFDQWQKWLALTHRNGRDWRGVQLAAARQFYHWRFTRGIGANCAEHTRVNRRIIRMPKRYSDAQLRAMLVHTAHGATREVQLRDRLILLLLITAGLRREEMTKLDLRDIELGKQTAVLRVNGKGAKQRDVPIEGPVVQLLIEWLAMREELPYPVEPEPLLVALATSFRGTRITIRALEAMLARHARGAGLREWGLHRFRVNYATGLYDEGYGIEEIRVLLGHSSIETTRRYLEVSNRARKTRLSAAAQHRLLGQRGAGDPMWMRAALGGLNGQ